MSDHHPGVVETPSAWRDAELMLNLRTPTIVAVLTLAAAAVPAAAASTSGVVPCRTSDLSARLGRVEAGAGQRYATLTLTNRSGHRCHTYGYVGMQLLDSRGRALPTDVVRDHSRRPARVTLTPGGHASSVLHWSVIPSPADPHGQCGRAPRALEVTPPDETRHLTIGWTAGQVCERGQITVTRLV